MLDIKQFFHIFATPKLTDRQKSLNRIPILDGKHDKMRQQLTVKNKAISDTFTGMKDVLLSIFRQAGIPEEDCKDLVQNVFLRLLSIDMLRLETIKSITATIALRMRTDYLRHKALMHRLYATADTADIFDYGYNDTSFDARELAQCESMIASKMNDSYRRIYEMSRFNGCSYEEIADAMNISYRAVESRLYRARNFVRNSIKEIYGT